MFVPEGRLKLGTVCIRNQVCEMAHTEEKKAKEPIVDPPDRCAIGYDPCMKYVLFLRGINVGGNKKVPMAELRKVLTKAGYTDVETLLNSGNVVMTGDGPTDAAARKMEAAIEAAFGFKVPVIVRTQEELQELADSDPFKGIEVTKDTRLYVSFLGAPTRSDLKIPYASPDRSFRILKVAGRDIISVLDLSRSGTPEAMGILEKAFGKNITTRNWNTVEKLLEM